MKNIAAVICAAFIATSVPAHADGFGDFLRVFAGGVQEPHTQTKVRRHHVRVGLDYQNSFHSGGGQTVRASFYGGGPRAYEPNSHTANGEKFHQWGETCAHRSLPFGTRLLVTFRGRSAVCRVNDRGPAAWTGRKLDVSRGIAHRIGLIGPGTGSVTVAVLR